MSDAKIFGFFCMQDWRGLLILFSHREVDEWGIFCSKGTYLSDMKNNAFLSGSPGNLLRSYNLFVFLVCIPYVNLRRTCSSNQNEAANNEPLFALDKGVVTVFDPASGSGMTQKCGRTRLCNVEARQICSSPECMV